MAGTPPPLAIPQPVAEPTTPIATLLATLSNALPDMNAEVANAIARTPGLTPDTALTAGQATQAFDVSSQQVQALRDQSDANQQAVWRTMPASQQKMLQSAGYKPPHTGGGLFSSIGHDFGAGLHDVLNAVGSPLRAVQHAERTLTAPPRSGAQAGFWGNLFSPQNWADAWEQTSNGSRYIMPSVERQVQSTYPEDTYQLALQLATGTDPGSLLNKAYQSGGDAAAAALAQQMKSPQVVNATRTLQAGHLSVGRVLAWNITSPTKHPALFTAISGTTDGTLDWFGDPTVVGSKAAVGARAGFYGVKDGVGVLNAYRSSRSVQNAMAFVAANSKDAATLRQAFPKLSPLIPDIVKANIATPDDAAQFFADNATVSSLIKYSPQQLPGMTGYGWMPTLSTTGQLRLAMKGSLQRAIDWAADGPAEVHGVTEGDLVPHALTGPLARIQAGRFVQGTGQFFKKATTIAPPREFDAYDDHWLDHLSEIADMALPRARTNQILNESASAADLGERRVIYTNLMKELFARMGIGDTPYGQDFIKNFNLTSDANPAALEKYAPGEIDMMDFGHGPEPTGILEPHLTTRWAVPDYRDLYAQSKKLGVTHAVMGLPNAEIVDNFMQQIWKPLSLARVGFALRVSGEEAFGALLRYGPSAVIRARLAASAVKQGGLIEPGMPVLSPIARTFSMLTQHLTPRQLQGIHDGAGLAATHFARVTTAAMRNVAGRLAGPEYYNAAKLAYTHGTVRRAFIDYISAGHGHGAGYLDSDVLGHKILQADRGRLVPAVYRKTGAFTEYDHNAGAIFAPMWHEALQEIAGSAWSRVALETADEPYGDRLNAVADVLERNKEMASRSALWGRTTDGRLVAEGEATQREVAVDWARRIIDNVDANVRTPVAKGTIGAHIEVTPGQSLAQHLLDVGRPPSVPLLESIPDELRPLSVKGPAMVAIQRGGTGFFTKFVTGMFDMIGRQIDWISREPMWQHNFASSLKAYGVNLRGGEFTGMAKTWKDLGMSDSEVERHAVTAATDRAIELTTPYIHNPELRSQFSNITRNLMPFWFAQEQFYKRWARNMAYSPWSFRQAQLISQGVQHSGFVHKDPTTGQEYFVYPGSTVVQDVLTRSLSAFGYKSFLPIGAALRGQVNQASPGLERLGLPNYGPLVVIPANLVKQWFPEIKGPVTTLEGPQAASTGFVRSLVPTTVVRIWQDATSSPGNSAQFSSAMMQAIQYLEATGHGIGTVATNNLGQINVPGIPPHAANLTPGDYVTNAAGREYVYQPDGTWKANDPAAMAEYQQRVKNWTRVFLINRTLFGFTGPASPQGLFDPKHLNEDLQALLKNLPFQDALAVFMKEHPDASAYTVFQTSTQAGDPLPATADAMSFLNANKSFMDNHTLAGAYFLPAVDTTGKFDLQAYQTQLAEQLRLKKDPAEFWKEIAYSTAATTYFNAEDRKNQLLRNPGAVGMNYQQINQAWVSASQQFLSANPLFASQLGVTPDTPGSLTGGQSTTYTRSDLLKDLVAALNDPTVPQTQQTEHVRTLVNSYIHLEAMVAPYGTPGTTSLSYTQRYAIETSYANQVQAYVAANPDVQGLYQRLIRPTLSSVLSSEAAAA